MKRIDFINKDEPVKNQILRQIIREINSLKTLSKSDDTGQYGKRNIISFYDYFSSQGHYYVLTEYCEVFNTLFSHVKLLGNTLRLNFKKGWKFKRLH